MTQTEKIYDHMKTHGQITQAEATTLYKIYRLASRICDLKKAGIAIDRELVSGKNEFGSFRYAVYKLRR